MASKALAGSVVCFPRPMCQNDDGDKKGGRLFWRGRLLRAVSRCPLGERVCCVCVCVHVDAEAPFVVCFSVPSAHPSVTELSCCSYRTEMAERKHSDECVPRHPGTPLESGSGESRVGRATSADSIER